MAHNNIDQRRRAVEKALKKKGEVPSPSERNILAARFNCSPYAIWSDILTLLNGGVFHISKSMRARIIERDRSICYLCGNKTYNPIVEHKIPARAGGKPTEENLAVACNSCNMKKRTRDAILYPIYKAGSNE